MPVKKNLLNCNHIFFFLFALSHILSHQLKVRSEQDVSNYPLIKHLIHVQSIRLRGHGSFGAFITFHRFSFFFFKILKDTGLSSFFVLIKHFFLFPLNFGWNALWRSRLYKGANAEWLPNRCSVPVPFFNRDIKSGVLQPIKLRDCDVRLQSGLLYSQCCYPPKPLQEDCTCTLKCSTTTLIRSYTAQGRCGMVCPKVTGVIRRAAVNLNNRAL